ncbi:MAG: Holliday junction resolvase RuvX [Saprospiraceae bacterium]|nr:Holliday junction resolvase RuvX [Saprospiraceae bacterium]
MSRIMSIDYGTKKTGIAVTDPLKIIATGLTTVPTGRLMDFFEEYFFTETVETIVFGEIIRADGTPGSNHEKIQKLMAEIKKKYPSIHLTSFDESFTSMRAKEIILKSGAKKKKRQDKSLVDKISAALILQDYMEANGI